MINCIILAGGNSRRMTFPKEYIEIEEKYLIHNSIEALKNLFDDIVVVSNNKDHYKDVKVRVVRDIFYKKGPMAGLHSGLCYSNNEFSFLTACDMPNMDEKFIRFLISKLDKDFDGLVCLSKGGKILPMNGIYKNSLKENLREELIKDNLKFVKFIEDSNFKFLEYEEWKNFDDKNIFENLNTIKELEEFKKKLLTINKD
ncbi:molybdenum cofactor guanylyltransferase [uncultured Parvimonas sp.]|uniref:molybdenum cofactor guanylyltransferase n=1 Tax=uncultured Parvimonas sp. TaxID=747372 RepID=UPI0028D02D1F|nr:molybdenum cofactor guanylyltransferase [uncultured Parvimonas sp.]